MYSMSASSMVCDSFFVSFGLAAVVQHLSQPLWVGTACLSCHQPPRWLLWHSCALAYDTQYTSSCPPEQPVLVHCSVDAGAACSNAHQARHAIRGAMYCVYQSKQLLGDVRYPEVDETEQAGCFVTNTAACFDQLRLACCSDPHNPDQRYRWP